MRDRVLLLVTMMALGSVGCTVQRRGGGSGDPGTVGDAGPLSRADTGPSGFDSGPGRPDTGPGLCEPDCSGRACGADPVCGISCGRCSGGSCEDGTCVEAPSGSPVIESFTSDVSTYLRRGTSLPSALGFHARVSDPDGDVSRGELVDADTNSVYAAFVRGDGDAFTALVSWNAFGSVRALNDDEARVVVARFFDADGHQVEDELTISFACSLGVLCDGECSTNSADGTLLCNRGTLVCDSGPVEVPYCDGACFDSQPSLDAAPSLLSSFRSLSTASSSPWANYVQAYQAAPAVFDALAANCGGCGQSCGDTALCNPASPGTCFARNIVPSGWFNRQDPTWREEALGGETPFATCGEVCAELGHLSCQRGFRTTCTGLGPTTASVDKDIDYLWLWAGECVPTTSISCSTSIASIDVAECWCGAADAR